MSVLDIAQSCRVTHLKPSSKDDIMTEASISLMAAKLRAAVLAAGDVDTVPSPLRCGKIPELPLELSTASTRQIAGLIQYMFSEKRQEPSRYKGNCSENLNACKNTIQTGSCLQVVILDLETIAGC